MNFHIAHMNFGGVYHGLNGYKDIIDTVIWGLESLGHTCQYSESTLSTSHTNIIFGAQTIPLEYLKNLPRQTIIYNFEQMREINKKHMRPQIQFAASHFQIWDYSEANRESWFNLGAKCRIVPVGYAPVLTKVEKMPDQYIDVLIYGAPGQERLDAFFNLCHAGLVVVFACGLYGNRRDELIARSKIVLNVTLYSQSKIFEIVRTSYLLANKKMVVSVVDADTYIEDDIRSGICTTTANDLVHTCRELLADDERRTALEEKGFAAIKKRDIRQILQSALTDYANLI